MEERRENLVGTHYNGFHFFFFFDILRLGGKEKVRPINPISVSRARLNLSPLLSAKGYYCLRPPREREGEEGREDFRSFSFRSASTEVVETRFLFLSIVLNFFLFLLVYLRSSEDLQFLPFASKGPKTCAYFLSTPHPPSLQVAIRY